MKTFIPARLRVPLAYALGGAIFAAAWAVRGGAAWWLSIVVAVSVAARTPPAPPASRPGASPRPAASVPGSATRARAPR
jgi:hypothetical protein